MNEPTKQSISILQLQNITGVKDIYMKTTYFKYLQIILSKAELMAEYYYITKIFFIAKIFYMIHLTNFTSI